MSAEPTSGSVGDLRTAIATTVERALLFKWEHQEPEPLWDVYKPEGMALVLTDAALAVLGPEIHRALAIAVAVDSLVDKPPHSVCSSCTGIIRYHLLLGDTG